MVSPMPIPEPLPHADRLRAFAVFAQILNFTRAAARLGLSQPALHGQVRQLAEELGAPLYRREGRRLALTDAGRAVQAHAERALQQAAALRATLAGQAHAAPARLAAGEGALLYLLGPSLRAAGVPLQCQVLDGPGALAAVRAGTADVAVTPTPPGPDLQVVPLARTEPVLQIPAGHPLAARAGPLPPEALAQVALVVPPQGGPLRARLDEALADVPWRAAAEARGWPLVLHLVTLGVGPAVVNGLCPQPPGTVRRPLPWLPAITYRAVRRAEPAGPAAATLWQAIAAAGSTPPSVAPSRP